MACARFRSSDGNCGVARRPRSWKKTSESCVGAEQSRLHGCMRVITYSYRAAGVRVCVGVTAARCASAAWRSGFVAASIARTRCYELYMEEVQWQRITTCPLQCVYCRCTASASVCRWLCILNFSVRQSRVTPNLRPGIFSHLASRASSHDHGRALVGEAPRAYHGPQSLSPS